MKNAAEVTMKNGRKAMKGTCPTCGTGMFRSRAEVDVPRGRGFLHDALWITVPLPGQVPGGAINYLWPHHGAQHLRGLDGAAIAAAQQAGEEIPAVYGTGSPLNRRRTEPLTGSGQTRVPPSEGPGGACPS